MSGAHGIGKNNENELAMVIELYIKNNHELNGHKLQESVYEDVNYVALLAVI